MAQPSTTGSSPSFVELVACQLSTFYLGEVVSLCGGGADLKIPTASSGCIRGRRLFLYRSVNLTPLFLNIFGSRQLSAGGCQTTAFRLCIEVCFVVVLNVLQNLKRLTNVGTRSSPWEEGSMFNRGLVLLRIVLNETRNRLVNFC